MGPIATVLSGPSLSWTIDSVFRAPFTPQNGARTTRRFLKRSSSPAAALAHERLGTAATNRRKPVNHLTGRRGEPTLTSPAEVAACRAS